MSRQRLRQFFRRLARWYRAAALLLLNTVVVFALVNLGLAVVFRVKDWADAQPPAPGGEPEPDEVQARLYPGYSPEEVHLLWTEFGGPIVYEPFVEFKEGARDGRYVNVHPAGFRHVQDQGPWPPDPGAFNVFVFGGSTTFGYGVADEDTWPSRLQEFAARRGGGARVYNFGNGYYYSLQERTLLERLLLAGHVPALALFMDGLNDFCFEKDETASSARFTRALEGSDAAPERPWLEGTLDRLPFGRAVQAVKRRLAPAPVPAAEKRHDDEADIRYIIRRYLENKRLTEGVCREYGVVPAFAWQPVPTYKYDLHWHPFAGQGFFNHTRSQHGYPAMAAAIRATPPGGHFLWLADIQEHAREALYVDLAHYSAKFSRELAAEVDRQLQEAGVYDAARRPRAGRRP